VGVGEVGKGAGVHLVNRPKVMVLISKDVRVRVGVGVDERRVVGVGIDGEPRGTVKRMSLVGGESIALRAKVVGVEVGVEVVKVGVVVEMAGRLNRTVKLKSSGNTEGPLLVLTEVGDSDATCCPLNVIERVLVGFSSPVSGSIRRR